MNRMRIVYILDGDDGDARLPSPLAHHPVVVRYK